MFKRECGFHLSNVTYIMVKSPQETVPLRPGPSTRLVPNTPQVTAQTSSLPKHEATLNERYDFNDFFLAKGKTVSA